MIKTPLRLTVSVFLIMVALFGCSSDRDPTNRSVAVASQQLSVVDSTDNRVTLEATANRIVALAPHIVENLFSIGAGKKIVGAMAYSNYPEAAKSIPIVGGYANVNIEKIIQLDPDLIIAWEYGNDSESINRLRSLGFKVYVDQPKSIADIANSFRNFGTLTGLSVAAEQTASAFSDELAHLQQRALNKSLVTTFYQVWNDPMQTINGSHIISDAIQLCGGVNIYADEPMIAPLINIESILERDPQAIVASGTSGTQAEWMKDWQRWSTLSAVKNNHLFFVNPDHIQRYSARILLGVDTLCQQLDSTRRSGS